MEEEETVVEEVSSNPSTGYKAVCSVLVLVLPLLLH